MEGTWIAQIVMSVVTTVIAFVIGRIDNKINIIRETKKERLEKLYIPFIKLYDSTHMACAYNFTNFTQSIQKQYIEVLINNKVYTTEFTRGYITRFMMIYSAISKGEEKSDDNIMHLNKTFNTICQLIHDEFHDIENTLYYSWGDKIKNKQIEKRYKIMATSEVLKNSLENNL